MFKCHAASAAARAARLAFLAALAAAAFAFLASALAACARQSACWTGLEQEPHLLLLLPPARVLRRLSLLLLLLSRCRARRTSPAPLRLPRLLLLLPDPFDTGIKARGDVDETAKPRSVLLLSACTLRLVLLLRVALVITARKSTHQLPLSGHE